MKSITTGMRLLHRREKYFNLTFFVFSCTKLCYCSSFSALFLHSINLPQQIHLDCLFRRSLLSGFLYYRNLVGGSRSKLEQAEAGELCWSYNPTVFGGILDVRRLCLPWHAHLSSALCGISVLHRNIGKIRYRLLRYSGQD